VLGSLAGAERASMEERFRAEVVKDRVWGLGILELNGANHA
jgi:hypothetical protein